MRATFFFLLSLNLIVTRSFSQASEDRQITKVLITNTSSLYDVMIASDLCDFKENIVCNRKASLSIMPKGSATPIQTVTHFVRVSEDGEYITKFADFNFDSLEDLAIRDIFNETTVYLFDGSKKQFVLNESFSNMLSESSSYRILTDEKTILAGFVPDDYYRDAKRFWKIIDNKPVLVKEEISTYDPDPLQPAFNSIRRELSGSEWKTSVNKFPHPDNDEWMLQGNAKLIERKEIVKIETASKKYDITIELPCTRAKGKKNEPIDSYYAYRKNKAAVVVLKDKISGSIIQSIQVKGLPLLLNDANRGTDGTFTWSNDRQYWLRSDDLNFDGSEDLLIINKESDSIKRYDVYLFSNTEAPLVYSPELTALYSKWSDSDSMGGGFALSVDAGTKTITLHLSYFPETEKRTYRVVNNKPELVRLVKGSGKNSMTKELVNGRWVKRIQP